MAKSLYYVLEVDDKGTATIKKFSGAVVAASNQAAAGIRSAYAGATKSVEGYMDGVSAKMARWASLVGIVVAWRVAGQVTNAMSAMGESAAQFEKSMSGIRAVLGPMEATGTAMESLTAKAREMGRTTVYSAVETAEAMRRLTLAGFNTYEVLSLIPNVLNLAAAGEMEVADAANLATDVLRNMGIAISEMPRVVDVLAKAAADSNLELVDLAQSFKYVGSTARAIGAPVEDVSAAFMILANSGIRGSMAGTALRRSFSVLLGSLLAGEGGLKRFNIQTQDSQGNFIGLANVIDQLHTQFKKAGLSGLEAANVLMAAFGQRAGPAMIRLFQEGGDSVRYFEYGLKTAAGTASQQASDRFNNLVGDLTRLKNASYDLAIEMYQDLGPQLRSVAQSLRDFTLGFSEFVSRTNFVKGLTDAFKILGEVLAGIALFKLASGLASINIAAIPVIARLSEVVEAGMVFNWRLGDMATIMGTTTRRMAGLVAGVGALAAAVGVMSYQITRSVMELTGWDKAVERFFEHAIYGGQDMGEAMRGAEEALALFNKYNNKFGATESLKEAEQAAIDLKSGMDAVNQAASAGADATQLRAMLEAMYKNVKAVRDANVEYRTMQDRIRILKEVAPTLWDQSVKATWHLADAISLAERTLKQKRDDAVESGERELRLTKEQTDAYERLKKSVESGMLKGPKIASPEMFKEIETQIGQLTKYAKENMVSLEVVGQGMGDTVVDWFMAYVNAGKVIPPALDAMAQAAAEFNAKLKAQTEEAKSARESQDYYAQGIKKNVDSILKSSKLISKEGFRDWTVDFSNMLIEVERQSGGAGDAVEDMAERIKDAMTQGTDEYNFMRAYRDDFIEMVQAAQFAGITVPEEIQKLYDFFSKQRSEEALSLTISSSEVETTIEIASRMVDEFNKKWKQSWRDFRDESTGAFADMFSQFLIYGGSFKDMFRELTKNIAAQGIAMLIKWGIQWLMMDRIRKASTASTTATALAGGMAQVFTNSFLSAAAIPIVGWAMAPGVAAMNLGLALAGASSAAAAGAGIGAVTAVGVAGAEGGVITKPVRMLVGEAGREAILPLEGWRGRQAAERMGISGGSVTVQVTNVFQGDNWSDTQVPVRITERIYESISSAIKLGRLRPLPVGTS